MIVILKPDATALETEQLQELIHSLGYASAVTQGCNRTIVSVLGNPAALDIEQFQTLPYIDTVVRVSEQYTLSGRSAHKENTVISLSDDVSIGDGHFLLIAGPCCIESRPQVLSVANAVKNSGANALRGGAYKPRTSPYDFQGLGREGLRLLLDAKKETGLPVVSEIVSIEDLELFDDVDVIQVGARSMQNFDLLRHLGALNKPVLLKRSSSATLHELLMSAEYLMSGGNAQVILCERGIRSFANEARYTLDLTAIPMLKKLTHLPVIVDPSHATGHAALVPSMSLAAVAAGADGLMIEVHNDPVHAKCDGVQALTTEEFSILSQKIRAVRLAIS